jgi:hypothetical protein
MLYLAAAGCKWFETLDDKAAWGRCCNLRERWQLIKVTGILRSRSTKEPGYPAVDDKPQIAKLLNNRHPGAPSRRL